MPERVDALRNAQANGINRLDAFHQSVTRFFQPDIGGNKKIHLIEVGERAISSMELCQIEVGDVWYVYCICFFWRGNHLYNSWKLYNHDYLKKEAISSFIIHHCRVFGRTQCTCGIMLHIGIFKCIQAFRRMTTSDKPMIENRTWLIC